MILIMGVAGAGKSMQGKLLAKKLGYEWLSTGELLRKYASDDKKESMAKGKLLDDDMLIDIIDKSLMKLDQSRIILDGFPRTLTQASWLLKNHKAKKINLEKVVLLEVPKATVVKRLLQRGRQDDNQQAIDKRFEEHDKMTLPIIDLYKNNNVNVEKVDGDKPVEEVTKGIYSLFK